MERSYKLGNRWGGSPQLALALESAELAEIVTAYRGDTALNPDGSGSTTLCSVELGAVMPLVAICVVESSTSITYLRDDESPT